MDFYTNVCRTRDKILVKGYQGNKQHLMKVAYRPNHYDVVIISIFEG